MGASDKLRVGIVGASASRGFASIAHIPALQGLPQFEIVAVCTTRQETANAAAQRYGARLGSSIQLRWRHIPRSIWSRSASRCRTIMHQ